MRVDHRRLKAAVSEKLLNRADVGPVFKQVRGERMTQRVARGALRNPARAHRLTYSSLNCRFMDVMPPALTSLPFERSASPEIRTANSTPDLHAEACDRVP
jgi:hypothetical protein